MYKLFQSVLLLMVFNSHLAAQDAANPNFNTIETVEETNQEQLKPINQEVMTKASATSNLTHIPTNIIIQSQSKESTVVFMRSTLRGVLVKSSVYEIIDGETKFIGLLKNKKKITYKTTPGSHTFMVIAESADFMLADLLPGKTYYSVIEPRLGAFKARFSMYPIRNDGQSKIYVGSKKFDKMEYKTEEVVLSQKSIDWYNDHKKKFEKKRVKYWQKWLEKSDDKKAQKTMNPEDGV